MKKYKKSKTALVADVDCTADGKPLCDANGVEGFPTIKWGDPSNLEDYEGGREYKDLKKFAKKNLKPQCSAKNLHLCKGKKKEQIEGYLVMDLEELKAKVQEGTDALKKAGEDLEAGQKKLSDMWKEMQEEKENTVKAVKDSGYAMMKSALSFREESNEKLEL